MTTLFFYDMVKPIGGTVMDVYIYGTGCGAGELIDSGLDLTQVRAFVDSAADGSATFLGKPVISPEALSRRDYDLVIVTSRQSQAIARRCQACGIDSGRLLFTKNHVELTDQNRCYELAANVLPEAVLNRLRRGQRVIKTPFWGEDEVLPEEVLAGDYVRVKTLEALCGRLACVPGAAAELGVYRGAFARCINALLPQRRLYLFDSFAGFDAEEAAHPALGRGFVQSHKNTTVDTVLAALPHPEQAVIMPGLFPQSLHGLEETFCLVSLDVDLEESTLAGLRYFYPRMAPGGYILLHDYNAPSLPGVRRAVNRYEAELGRPIPAVPLCDVGGTLVVPVLFTDLL